MIFFDMRHLRKIAYFTIDSQLTMIGYYFFIKEVIAKTKQF